MALPETTVHASEPQGVNPYAHELKSNAIGCMPDCAAGMSGQETLPGAGQQLILCPGSSSRTVQHQ
jgi:hypothetical protein